MRRKKRGLSYYIVLGLLILAVIFLYQKYQTRNFNKFNLMEYNLHSSIFSRDKEVKYLEEASYKIESKEANDAMFVQTISVNPHTAYRISCMVKTQDVKAQKGLLSAGAHISIADTVEKSDSVVGTKDWQRIELLFNSRNRTTVDVGFRLGGYEDNCTGTVWFSDFKIESGLADTSNNWKFVCFIFEELDIQIGENKERLNLKMTSSDINDMQNNMGRFQTSCQSLSNNQMHIEYDTFVISEPIKTLSYDSDHGYYVAPEDVKDIIKPYLEQKEYDYIFVALRMGDLLHTQATQSSEWAGLGGMDYLGIGYANIRLPNDSSNYVYKYNARFNTFPEEVFVHEFLHTLERNMQENGFEVPALHDYEKYGYKQDSIEGQRKWLQDYMRGEIKDLTGNFIGLNSQIYKVKPVHSSNFEFSSNLKLFDEPQNIIEEIRLMFYKIGNNVKNIRLIKEENAVE